MSRPRRSGSGAKRRRRPSGAEQAAKQIPANSKDGTEAPGVAAARADMADWTGAAAYARGARNPFAKISALAALAMVEQRHDRADDAKANFALAIEIAQAEEMARRAGLLARRPLAVQGRSG